MSTHNIPPSYRKTKEILILPPDLVLLSTLIGSNYPCLELIFMVPRVVRAIKVRLYIHSYMKVFLHQYSRHRGLTGFLFV